MPKISLKKQQIKQREEDILKAALILIENTGFGSLKMDQLAQQSGCTKGTLYNHFINKEDLLCELGVLYCHEQMRLYQRLDSYAGNSREKVMALFLAYQIFSFSNKGLFSCVLHIQSDAQMERASAQRLAVYREAEMALVMRIVSAIQLGLDQGDIESHHQSNVLQLAFTGWATAFGNIALMMSSQGAFLTQQADREAQLLSATQFMLDGLAWRPLSTDKDYQKSWTEIGNTFFNQELLMLRKQN